MASKPKLSPLDRAMVMNLHQKRRALMRMAKRLEQERQALPSLREIARDMGVSYSAVMRSIHGRMR